MGKQPTKVDKIPEGYVFSHKDENGRDIYKISSSKPPAKSTGTVNPKPVVNATTSTSLLRPPVKRKPAVYNEDFVYIEPKDTIPSILAPVPNPNIPLYEDKRIDRKLQPPINPNIDYYKYPDQNAGYSKSTNRYFDKATGQEVLPESIGENGIYTPKFVPNSSINQGVNLGTVKQGNPRVTITPEVTEILKGNEDDKTGSPKATLGTIGFKKGGLVNKIKGYAIGGGVGYNEFSNINGLVNQNDPYSDQMSQLKIKKEEDERRKNSNIRNASNIAGSGLGAYGSAYYSTQQPESEGESARQSGLSTISKTGPIGGVIGGLAAIGDQLGKPTRTRSEKLNSDGSLSSPNMAKRNAIVGITLSPSKRLSYKGGLTDVTGSKYIASIEDKAKEQIKSVNEANKQAKIQQALDARDSGNFDYKPQNIYDTNASYFNDNKELVLADGTVYDPNNPRMFKSGGLVSKAKQMCKDGGVIKGKGTSKSDSISAKVKPGSFIVPAENAKAAEIIRKEVLAKPPRPKANLNQKGGEEVKLSNGEHMFTKEEKEKLIKKGINVNELAPEAEQKEYFQFPKIFGYKDGGPVKGAKIDGATWDGNNWVDAKGNKYTAESGKRFTDRYNASVAKSTKDASDRKSNELSLYKRKYNEAKNSGNDKEASALLKKINELNGTGSVDTSTRNNSGTKTTSSLKVPKSAKTKETFEPIERRDVAASELKKANEIKSDKVVEDRDTDLAVSSITPIDNKAPTYTKKESKGLTSSLSSIDPTALIGPAQLALGAKMLRNTRRPVYKPEINRDFNKSVDQAIQQANYGFSPEERFLNEQNIQNSVNDAKYSGLNLSGRNATQAFNQQRAAINSGLAARIEAQVADQRLRREKQQYANQLIANRAGMAAQNAKDVFNIANDTFNQRQQSGAELVGAGLANSVGAYRYNRDLQRLKEIDAQRGYSLDNYNYKA